MKDAGRVSYGDVPFHVQLVGPGLADAVVSGEWNGALQLRFENRTHAEEIQEHMDETSSG
jgi:hypothetical protein